MPTFRISAALLRRLAALESSVKLDLKALLDRLSDEEIDEAIALPDEEARRQYLSEKFGIRL